MGEQVWYLEKRGKIWQYSGAPWATSEENLAWFIRWALDKGGDKDWTVQGFHPEPPEFDTPPVWQRNPRWINSKLGYDWSGPRSTIGNYGCVVCSFAWILSVIRKQEVTPAYVNREMVKVKGFSGSTGNLVIWKKAEEAFPGIKINWDYPSVVRAAPVERMYGHLESGGYLICKVDFKPVDDTIQSHYLPILDISTDRKIGRSPDPWTGMVVSIPPAYFNEDRWSPRNLGRSIMRTIAISFE